MNNVLEQIKHRNGEIQKKYGMQMGVYVYLLYTLVRESPKVEKILEIGTSVGISTNAILNGLNDKFATQELRKYSKLYSVDIRDCFERAAVPNHLQDLWEFIQADSSKLEWDHGALDMLLIDGDHHYDYIKSDYEKFVPFVKPGGIILLHDVSWPQKGVSKFYKEDLCSPGVILNFCESGMALIVKEKNI